MEAQKVCSKCKQIKPLAEFHKTKRRSDGHCTICRKCVSRAGRERRAKNLEKYRERERNYSRQNASRRAAYMVEYNQRPEVKERDKERRRKNSEQINKKKLQRYYLNHEENLEKQRKYRQENRERIRKNAKDYYGRNKKRYRGYALKYKPYKDSYMKDWRQRNMHLLTAYHSTRKAAKLQRTPPWLNDEMKRQICETYKDARRLTRETGTPHHVDHIVPLRPHSGVVSRLHVPWNLRITTASENLQKGDTFDPLESVKG